MCVDVALDLRQFALRIDDQETLRTIWNDLAPGLIGQQVQPGCRLVLEGQHGSVELTVLDTHNVDVIDDNIYFNIIDVERNPAIRHPCKECAKPPNRKIEFGPFACPGCREKNLPARLCEAHSHFLENRYTVFCGEHRPPCHCRANCTEGATFECDYCRREFGQHYRRQHQHDSLTLLCVRCYERTFERCEECERLGKSRLGKSRCMFPTGQGNDRHSRRLCTFRHARQWQIWGPHWHGVTFCEEHYQQLSQSSPDDLLWIMVTARAPAPYLRARFRNSVRVRNILRHTRSQDLSWDAIDNVLQGLAERAAQSNQPRYIRDNIAALMAKVAAAQGLEAQLLEQVRVFYAAHLRRDPETLIQNVTLRRAMETRGKTTYQIVIRRLYDNQNKGILIGREGTLIKELEQLLQDYAVHKIDIE